MSGENILISLGQVAEVLGISIDLVRRRMDDDDAFPLPVRVYLRGPLAARFDDGPGHTYRWRLADVARYAGLSRQGETN
jgi:hypothetical protein